MRNHVFLLRSGKKALGITRIVGADADGIATNPDRVEIRRPTSARASPTKARTIGPIWLSPNRSRAGRQFEKGGSAGSQTCPPPFSQAIRFVHLPSIINEYLFIFIST
jgi:hypothetical protein